MTEIPGPHSRKITTTAKSRLQQICYRLLRRSDEERIRIGQLPKYFPDQDEIQLKQRLKVPSSFYVKPVLTLERLTSRSSWNIKGKDHIKASGG